MPFPGSLHQHLDPKNWSPECWSLPYVRARVADILYRKRNPQVPWLTPDANQLLQSILTEDQQWVEFGSGRSTCYLAKRVAHLTSVETSLVWAERVSESIQEAKLGKKVDLYLEGADGVDLPDSVDGVLVDGGDRMQHTLWATEHLRPGGWLILDNANRYVPNQSIGPGSIRDWTASPSPSWRTWWQTVSSWEQHWTTNGVTDTWLGKVPD